MEKFDKIALGIILVVLLSEILVFFSLMEYREIGFFQLIEVLTWILFSNFLLGWYFMFGGFWTLLVKILLPMYDMNLPYYFSYIKTGYIYLIFYILGWLSVPIIAKYTNGLHPVKRLIYIYILPQLIMGIAFMLQFPFH
ncbi:hypothetical protein B6V01_004375 [Methanosarcinales archaeon ex4572_44]|nr:MAG: hypothetical protein B6U67_03540 [Methanosarcinales archaeon ex4484_138]PHP45369.1 MAG: hypothetical protein B6V01_004375 [Methanosarcinales archaeon ex4572_44]